jgi:isoleucyl-tRNA synthetase
MFDLNETINWKPKSTGEGRFGNWIKCQWLEFISFKVLGNPIANLENRRQTRRNLIGSVEELYNEIEKSIQAGFQKEKPFKGFEIGNMDEENYDLIDLHKM